MLCGWQGSAAVSASEDKEFYSIEVLSSVRVMLSVLGSLLRRISKIRVLPGFDRYIRLLTLQATEVVVFLYHRPLHNELRLTRSLG